MPAPRFTFSGIAPKKRTEVTTFQELHNFLDGVVASFLYRPMTENVIEEIRHALRDALRQIAWAHLMPDTEWVVAVEPADDNPEHGLTVNVAAKHLHRRKIAFVPQGSFVVASIVEDHLPQEDRNEITARGRTEVEAYLVLNDRVRFLSQHNLLS